MSQEEPSPRPFEGPDPSERETLVAPPSAPSTAPTNDAPPVVDRYSLLERIGSGGMGEVWLAEQQGPVRRRVALKVIKAGMDTVQVIARFEAERQALTLMDHPGIARVLDAGSTKEGRPYFVMEHVAGEPITVHCDRHRLSTRDRLELFVQVCDAVQHAHQKAVIHRDLKPTNVLVSTHEGRVVPKIIDFGLAKAMAQPFTEGSPRTALGTIVGTPGYMSPEQADYLEQEIDTQTDVYSLGVILYELLVGVLPFEWARVQEAGWEGLRQFLTREESPRPSTRLSSIDRERSSRSADRRRTDARSLKRQLTGDLDWITLKALAREKERRYGSAAELGEEIRRHLRNEPVVAGPPGVGYRLGKFIRRHRVGVAAASVLLAGLAAGTLGAGFGLVRARQAEAEARREAEISLRVSGFLADLVGSIDPERMGRLLTDDLKARSADASRARGRSRAEMASLASSFDQALAGVNRTDTALHLLDEEILQPAGRTIDAELARDPLIAARLQLTMGQTYRRLGLFEPAETYARSAVETRRRILGENHPDTLAAMSQLAVACADLGRMEEAERLHRQTLESRRRLLGEDHPDTLASMHNLALAYQNQNRLQEAEDMYEQVLAARRRVLGEEHPFTLRTMNNLANVYNAAGRRQEAERLSEQTLEIRRRVLGEDHPDTLASQNNLAITYLDAGQYDRAERLYLAALEALRRKLGEEHPDTYRAWNNLGQLYSEQGLHEKAAGNLGKAYSGFLRSLGPEHPETLLALSDLARAYHALGRLNDAERCLRQVVEATRRMPGRENPEAFAALGELAGLLRETGRPEAARPFVLRRLESLRRTAEQQGAGPADLNALAWELLTCEPVDLRRTQEALALSREAAKGEGGRDPAILDTLALAYHRTGQTARAVTILKEALADVPADDRPMRDRLEKSLVACEAKLSARK